MDYKRLGTIYFIWGFVIECKDDAKLVELKNFASWNGVDCANCFDLQSLKKRMRNYFRFQKDHQFQFPQRWNFEFLNNWIILQLINRFSEYNFPKMYCWRGNEISFHKHFNAGLSFHEMGNNRSAVQSFNVALAVYPNNHLIFRHRSLSLCLLKRYDEAFSDCDRVESLYKGNDMEFLCKIPYTRGNCYRDMGKNKEAIEEFSKSIGMYPYYTNAYFNRGASMMSTRDYHGGVNDFSAVLRLSPNDFEAKCMRSFCYFSLENYNEALKDCDQVLKVSCERVPFQWIASASMVRGLLYGEVGQSEKSLFEYQRANKVCSSRYPFALYKIGDFFFLKEDYESALPYYLQSLEIKKSQCCISIPPLLVDWSAFYWKLGYVCFKKRMYEKALEFFKVSNLGVEKFTYPVEETLPFSLRNNIMGNCLLKLNKLEDAIKMFTTSLDLNPENASSYCCRGMAYRNQRKYKEAIQDFNFAIKISPSLVEAYNNRCLVYTETREFGKALKDINKAMEMSKPNYNHFFNRGNIFLAKSEYQKAIEDYDRAEELYPSNMPGDQGVYTNRGNANLFSYKYENALNDYNSAVRILLTLKEEHQNKKQETLVRAHELYLSSVLNNRASLLIQMKKYDLAKMDLLSALELEPSSSVYLCHIGECLAKLKDIKESVKFFKKAISLDLFDLYSLKMKVQTLKNHIEPEVILDDYARLIRLSNMKISRKMGRKMWKIGPYSVNVNVEKEDNFGNDTNENEMKEIVERLHSSVGAKDRWYPFQKDELKDSPSAVSDEEESMKQLGNLLKNVDLMKNMFVYRFLGKGSFGRTYVCRVKNVNGVFVLKVFKEREKKKQEKFFKKESLNIGYNRNVVMTLSHSLQLVDFDVFPDSKTYWEDKWGITGEWDIGFILMKYYRKDLARYILQRREDSAKFTNLELCYLLKGILEGGRFLNQSKIVHRDIMNLGNIFVDEVYGRVYIGDFGCCLDLRSNSGDDKGTFRVKKDDEIMYSSSGYNAGGNLLPPEIQNFDKSDPNQVYLDYSRSDIFSIGYIGYKMVSLDLFAKPYPENGRLYKDLPKDYCDESIAFVIKNLLEIDPGKRMEYEEAIKILEDVTTLLEDRKSGELEPGDGEKDNNINAMIELEKEEFNKDTSVLVKKAAVLEEEKKLEESLQILSKVLKIDPTNLFAWNNRGSLYMKLSRFEESVKDLTEGFELAMKNGNKPFAKIIIFNRGSAYRGMKDFEKGIEDYTTCLEMGQNHLKLESSAPPETSVFCGRGMCYLWLEKYEEAIAEFSNYLAFSERLIQEGEIGRVLDILEKRGKCYKEIGEKERAQEDFRIKEYFETFQ